MDVIIKGTLIKIARSLAFLWFYSDQRGGDWMQLFVYDRHFDVADDRLTGKRITITIEIEDDPFYRSIADDQ